MICQGKLDDASGFPPQTSIDSQMQIVQALPGHSTCRKDRKWFKAYLAGLCLVQPAAVLSITYQGGTTFQAQLRRGSRAVSLNSFYT
jgi:hypothetical protein